MLVVNRVGEILPNFETMKKNFFHVAIALVGLAAFTTSCSKPTLEEQLAGSYNVTNFDQSANVGGIALSITDQSIDPTSAVNLTLGDEGMTNPFSAIFKMTVRVLAVPFLDETQDIDESITGTWMAKKAGDVGQDSLIWTDADGMKSRFGIVSFDKTTLVLKGTMTEVDPDLGAITLNQDITLVKK
jgi:hypothetical protein